MTFSKMNRPLPVTLIGGFTGAGKTSLLHHFISEYATKPMAVFVENMGGLDLDAKALKGLCGAMNRAHDVVVEIPAGGEAEQIAWIADRLRELSRNGEVSRVLIEIAGTSNAARLGRHFGRAGRFFPHAALERIICVVDALDFFHGVVIPSRRDGIPPFLDFQRVQIEGASLLVLNKCDLMTKEECAACVESMRRMNPDVALIEAAYGELASQIWLQSDSEQQLQLALEPREHANITESTLEETGNNFEIVNSTYRVFRPFHPARFWDWFEAEQPGLLRVKGLVWLASRNLLVGGISRTRWQRSCGGAGVWWDALPREEWPTDRTALERMQQNWREPWGDRRQELTLLGDAKTLPGIVQQLAGCLLTDAEFARPTKEWRAFPDPFPVWDLGGEG